MPMNDSHAEKLSIALLQIMGELDDSARFVKETASPERWNRYRKAVGKAMGEVALELAEPLWEEYPHLKPEALGGPYKVNPGIYRPSLCEE